MSRSNQQVYGTENVTPIPKELVDERIMLLNRKLGELMLCHWTNRDDHEIKVCQQDISFWKRERDRGVA